MKNLIFKIYVSLFALVIFSQCKSSSNSNPTEAPKEIPSRSESSESPVQEPNSTVYSQPDQMPRWPGCSDVSEAEAEKCTAQGVTKYLEQNLVYPDSTQSKGINGLVFVRFVISASGKIEEPQILISPNDELSYLTLLTLQSFPDFIPGRVNNEPVRSSYILPFRFEL